MTLWIALPVYNEAPRVGLLLDRWTAILRDLDLSHRFVIVNDGSTDESPRILAEFAKQHPADIITHAPNQGLGRSLRDLFMHVADCAGDDLIVTMDADNTHPPELLPAMLDPLDRSACDVVIASRFRPGARVDGLSTFRRATAIGAAWLFRILLPVPGVRDYTCGFRLLRVSALRRAVQRDGERFCARPGFECSADVLLSLAAAGATFIEVPLVLEYAAKDGESHMNVARTIRSTVSLVLQHRRGR